MSLTLMLTYPFMQRALIAGTLVSLCAALLGCPYERGAVLEALQSHGIDGAVYRISAKELASVVVD